MSLWNILDPFSTQPSEEYSSVGRISVDRSVTETPKNWIPNKFSKLLGLSLGCRPSSTFKQIFLIAITIVGSSSVASQLYQSGLARSFGMFFNSIVSNAHVFSSFLFLLLAILSSNSISAPCKTCQKQMSKSLNKSGNSLASSMFGRSQVACFSHLKLFQSHISARGAEIAVFKTL